MIATYSLDFSTIKVYDNYILMTANEGVIIQEKHHAFLQKHVIEKHFKNKPFVAIINRINSYSIDPTIYLKTVQTSNLLGFAIVSNDSMQKTLIEVEKLFFKKEFHLFQTMDEALTWKDHIISKQG